MHGSMAKKYTMPQLLWAAVLLAVASNPYARAAEPHRLDISLYTETFAETFRGPLDVTPWGPSKWIAHTPWHGDFGDAQFSDPGAGFPFKTGHKGLKIIARKNADGKWQSGLLCSLDPEGRGFAQAGGYFEARMKMPSGPGVWPAFWLVTHTGSDDNAEIDVVEYYGKFTDGYHVTSHLWPKAKGVKPESQEKVIAVPEGSLTQAFHTYGVEILDNELMYYLDRHEVARLPASPAAKLPLSVLVNLALGAGWPIDETPDPSVLEVDYVKAFMRNWPQPGHFPKPASQ
jgi:beta-glucanase (GH16 family)